MVDSIESGKTKTELEPHGQAINVWSHTDTGVVKKLDGVFLGAKVSPDGWGAGFVDRVETPVEDAGIVFGVEQASYGPTGIFAKALPGFKVEALDTDSEGGGENWVEPRTPNEDVSVTFDSGRMSGIPLSEWLNDTNFGNPGTQIGVVRVTGPDGQVRHYALGADFVGKQDNWRVTGGVVEVTLRQPDAVTTPTTPELTA